MEVGLWSAILSLTTARPATWHWSLDQVRGTATARPSCVWCNQTTFLCHWSALWSGAVQLQTSICHPPGSLRAWNRRNTAWQTSLKDYDKNTTGTPILPWFEGKMWCRLYLVPCCNVVWFRIIKVASYLCYFISSVCWVASKIFAEQYSRQLLSV